jgi:hypothetical protein
MYSKLADVTQRVSELIERLQQLMAGVFQKLDGSKHYVFYSKKNN